LCRPARFAPLMRFPFVNRTLPRVLRLVRVVRADSWHASASPRSGDRRRSGFGAINAGTCSQFSCWSALLAEHVAGVPLVLFADEFQKVPVGLQKKLGEDGPGARVHLRIVDDHFHVHVTEISTTKALGQVEGFALGVTGLIEPRPAIEADGVDDECLAFPFADREALP